MFVLLVVVKFNVKFNVLFIYQGTACQDKVSEKCTGKLRSFSVHIKGLLANRFLNNLSVSNRIHRVSSVLIKLFLTLIA